MALILIVDDDEDVLKTIQLSLTKGGYQVIAVNNGYQALQHARRERPNLVILDYAMPEIDGIEVCRQLRASPATASVPILFLTAYGSIDNKIAGFDAGADDYLVKPFALQELNLRVKALLRRGAENPGESLAQISVGNLSLDCRTFDLMIGNRKVLLTPVEFELLHYMMTHAGQVLSTEQLLRDVWQYPPGTGSSELVRAHIKNLRNKIETNPKEPVYLKTIGRFGYTIGKPEST
jgi:DNA-binding response OmpR family regulator